MPALPKLRVKSLLGSEDTTDIYSLEQAKNCFEYGSAEIIILVEGEGVNTHEELIQLAAKNSYKDREFLEVVVLSAGLVDGG